jgi:hypothetical protein
LVAAAARSRFFSPLPEDRDLARWNPLCSVECQLCGRLFFVVVDRFDVRFSGAGSSGFLDAGAAAAAVTLAGSMNEFRTDLDGVATALAASPPMATEFRENINIFSANFARFKNLLLGSAAAANHIFFLDRFFVFLQNSTFSTFSDQVDFISGRRQ